MEIRKEVKRQVVAVLWIALVLYLLFDGTRLLRWGTRVYSALAPGGFRVSYYSGTDFAKLICRRSERFAFRDYGNGRPCLWVRKDRWSARWDAVLMVPQTAEYSFYLQSDDGSRVYIDDRVVVDYWSDHGWIPGKQGSQYLQQGQHRIRIEHYDRNGDAAVRLKWDGGPIAPDTVLGVPFVRKP